MAVLPDVVFSLKDFLYKLLSIKIPEQNRYDQTFLFLLLALIDTSFSKGFAIQKKSFNASRKIKPWKARESSTVNTCLRRLSEARTLHASPLGIGVRCAGDRDNPIGA